MSEPATEPPGGPPGRGQGKKILGMKRGTAVGVGVVGLVVLVVLVLRARKNAAASSSATTGATATGSCPDGSAPDANGNCPQTSGDFSGQLETLESEIAALQGAMASGSGGGGSAGTVGAATGTTTTTTPAPAAATTTTPAATTPAKTPAGPISNLQTTSVGTTTATVRWNAAQGATGGYSYQLTDTKTNSKRPSVPTRATSVNLTGLTPGTTYNFGVQALPGGPGNNVHFTTK